MTREAMGRQDLQGGRGSVAYTAQKGVSGSVRV